MARIEMSRRIRAQRRSQICRHGDLPWRGPPSNGRWTRFCRSSRQGRDREPRPEFLFNACEVCSRHPNIGQLDPPEGPELAPASLHSCRDG